MAEIVLGMATSHGPTLSTPPEQWNIRAADDMRNPELHFRGRVWTYEPLVKEREAENFAAKITIEERTARFNRCQKALDEMARIFAEVKPDAVVLVGNDQMEMFWDGLVPAFAVYWGKDIVNRLPPPEAFAKLPPGIQVSMSSYAPAAPATYPGAPDLALHLLKALQAENFDVASMTKIPPHRGGYVTIPHAFGFIFRRIMGDDPPPTVPVVENTFYPPNQPTVSRCIDFGKALVAAIKSWPANKRVAIIGSGGLSHFVIDEQLDAIVIDAIRSGNAEGLNKLTEADFQSGTSEAKNWIPVIGAMTGLGLSMNVVDYVPCYRTLAGTGTANCFVYWRQ
jgi:3-O-methylgallate 3,4-dioxygenase